KSRSDPVQTACPITLPIASTYNANLASLPRSILASMPSLNLAKYLILPDYSQRPIDSVGFARSTALDRRAGKRRARVRRRNALNDAPLPGRERDGGHAARHLCHIAMASRRLCPPYGSES